MPVKPFSVLIPDGDNHRALKVVRSLAYAGCRKIYIFADRGRNVHFSKHCRSFLITPENKKESGYLDSIVDAAERHKIDILLPVSEKGVKFAIQNQKILETHFRIAPLPRKEAFETAADKWRFHQFCLRNHLPVPKSVPVLEMDTDKSVIDRFTFPVLLKPAVGEGGWGIEFVSSKDELWKKRKEKKGLPAHDRYIVQEYIDGEDKDLSVICNNGRITAYTVQEPIEKHSGAFSFGKIIRFIRDDRILDIGKQLLSAMRWNGVVHIDFMIDRKSNTVKLLEMNPRFWGSLYGSVSAGVNFPYLSCLSAVNEAFSLPGYKMTHYAELTNKEKLFLLFGKKQGHDRMTLRDTDFRYAVSDPLMSIKNLFHIHKR